jgi:ABC-type multidrug transport system fused ATPase/permease subunit
MLPSMVLFSESLVLLGLCTLLLVVEPLGSIIVFFILAATAWSFQLLTRKHITRWGRERQRHEGMRIQHLQQGLGGAKDVKLLGRETEFLEQYREHNAQSAHFGQLNGTLQQLPKLWLELLAVTGIALLVIGMLARGSDISSIVPTIGVFGIAAFRLMPSVSRILAAVHSLRYGLPIINTLHEELNLPVDRQTLQKTLNSSTLQHEIRLTDVSFAYTDSAPALNSLSIVIKKGETVGFIGPSGSGKSTLVDIILGLLSPSSGKVTMDGQDIQQNPRAWQDQIGYVPQSIYLTDDTLRRNVAFGLSNEQIDDKGVQRAIHAAQLEEFVVSLPEGLETIVGERGIRLSGGQRQRIGIARAHYHNPVVLVLDEATSSLDSATEHDVMQAVRDMQGTKTIIIVAHRLSTVAHCDRLYRLERGRVVQVGRPDDLIMGEIG